MHKNSKIVQALTFMYMWILMGGCSYHADYYVYMGWYDTQVYITNTEFGYILLSKICSGIGLSFEEFCYVYYFIFLVVLFFVIHYSAIRDIHLFLVLYLVTDIFVNTCGQRQAMANVLLLLSIVLLSKMKPFFSLGVLICAFLFHKSVFFVFPFFAYFHNHAGVLRKQPFLLLPICMITFLNENRIPFIEELASTVIEEERMIYFFTSTNFGFIKFFGGYFIVLLLVYFLRKSILRNSFKRSEFEVRYAEKIVSFVLYLSFSLPLLMMNSNFNRFVHFSVLPACVLACMVHSKFVPCTDMRVHLHNFVVIAYVVWYQIFRQIFFVVEDVLGNNNFF